MANAVLLPKLGQTVEEASIVRWLKKEGDVVKKGDILFEIETDKAVLEVESFYEGMLLKVLVGVNDPVPVSTTVGFIGEKGEKVPDKVELPAAPPPAPEKKEAKPAEKPQAAKEAPKAPKIAPAAPAAPVAPPPPPPAAAIAQRLFISPRAKALCKCKVIDPAGISGSGPNGRIVVKDVTAYLDEMGYDNIRISPAARKLASQEGIDILSAAARGSGDRLMVDDIKRLVAERPKPLTKMRSIISSRLTESFRDVPHFYVTVSADMTELLAYRQELKAGGAEYSVTDFILEAVIISLDEFDIVNSHTDGSTIEWSSTVDLGMAVGLEEGLVVPVIKNAVELSMQELHDTVKDLAVKARSGKLTPGEMTGSTFTVSNMGMFGVDNFNAIINPGESAILAVASTKETPVVIDGKVQVRSIMQMTLSVDHRIVDGTVGAEFVNAIKAKLEDIELWKMLTY